MYQDIDVYDPRIVGSVESDFWEQNPHVKYIEPYSELVSNPDGSRLMWLLFMIEDAKSPYRGQPREELIESKIKSYFRKPLDYSSLSEYSLKWRATFMTEEERMFLAIQDKLRSEVDAMTDPNSTYTLADQRAFLKTFQDTIRLLRTVKEELNTSYKALVLKNKRMSSPRETRALEVAGRI